MSGEPIWRRHVTSGLRPENSMFPQKPNSIPNAVKACQLTASPPRMYAGEHSAARIPTVEAFIPSPKPRTSREKSRIGQVRLKADNTFPRRHTRVAIQIVPLLPMRTLIGCESQQPHDWPRYIPQLTNPRMPEPTPSASGINKFAPLMPVLVTDLCQEMLKYERSDLLCRSL